MEKDLIKFYENITKLNKDIVIYEDSKGNYQAIPTGQLICNCSYSELDDVQYKQAVFQGVVEDKDYNIIDTVKKVPKNEITKIDKDKYTIIDKKIKAKQVWIVSNGIKICKSFTDKEEAVKVAKEINNKILDIAEIK